MIDWKRWLPGMPDDEEDPVSKTLRALGQGASDIGTGISSAASSATEAVGSGLSSAAEAVSPYLAAPGGGSPVGGGPRRLEPGEPGMLEQLPQVAAEYGRAASGTLGDRGAMLAGMRPPETPEEVLRANAPAPARAGMIASEVGSAAMGAALGEYGERAAGTEPTFVTNEIQTPLGTIPSVEGPTPRQVGSAVGSVVGDPTSWVLPGTRADRAADLAIRNLAGPVARAAAAPVRAAGRAVGNVVGEAAEGLGAALGRNAENVAAADARMAAEGGPALPATLGGLPEPGRAGRQTVEVLQERLDTATASWQRAREAGDERMAALAREHAVDLESQLVDAQNARRQLEPAITSDVGRRVESLPLAEETADTLSGAGSRRADVEGLGGPVSHVPSSINLNAGLGGLPEGGQRRWVPDARYQSGGFWHTPAARVPDDLRAAQREVILRNADHLGAVRAREEIEASLRRAPDDAELQRELMNAIAAEERAKETVDAAREWQQMVTTGDKTLATSGTLPATRGAGALASVNRALGEGIAGGVGGAVIEQGRNPDEDPRTAAARGFAVGAVGFPAATRLARGAARLAGAGDGAARGALGTLGAAPDPDEVADLARRAAATPMTGPHTNGQHVTRNVARQIRKQADAGVPPEVPDGPMAPPNPPPSWWDHVENWRYNLGLFAQLSTGMVQAAGGVVQAAGGGAAEAVRLGVLKGQGEALPLIAAEGLKALPGAVASSLRTAAGQVPKAIEAGSDYKPSLHAREFAQGNVGRGAAALAIGTPGRVMTQAPDALWYDFFYKTGLGQAAADVVNAEMGAAPLRGLAGGAAGAAGGYASTPEDASPKERVARTLGGAIAGGAVSSLGPNSIARASRMRDLIANPTPEMVAEATKLAQNATYKGEPGPWFGAPKAIGKAVVEKIPSEKAQGFFGGLGSFFMPIYNTIARIHEQALEYTPGVGMLPLEQVGLAPKGQARPISRRLAQQAVGGSLVLGGLAYAAEGGIRGPGPSNPNEAQAMRDQGYTPNTTNVAGYWVPNSWFGPWGPILNEIGAVNDARIYDHGDAAFSDLSLEKQAYAILKMSARAARDYPALDTAQTITKLFTNPEDAFPSFLGEVAAQFVPGPVRTKAQAEDTKARTRTRGEDVPFEQRAWDTFRQRSGYDREQLPVAQDILGRDVENPRQGWARALAPNIREEKPDPIIQAYLDANLNIGDPATELTIPSLKDTDLKPQLTPEETRRWDTLRGEALIRRAGPAIASPDWHQRPPESRQRLLETKRTEAAEEAHGRLRSEIGAQEINRRISEARAAKQRKAS